MENIINPTNQPSNLPEINQTPPMPSKSNPLLLTILILFIILISAGAFVLGKFYSENKKETIAIPPTPIVQQPTVFPTTDPTANWKTYTGNNYYFKYPSDWEVKNLLSTDQNLEWLKTTSIYLGIRPNTIGEDVLGNIRITSDSLQTVINDTKTQMLTPGSPTKLLSEKEINFNSDQATELIFENTIAKVKSRFIIISKAEKTYILSGGGIEDATLIDQILSTFRFLDDTQITSTPQTTGTENWKTYTDSKNKYSFMYPLNWGIGSKCVDDTRIDRVKVDPALLKYPSTQCGTAIISSSIEFYIINENKIPYDYEIIKQENLLTNSNVPYEYYILKPSNSNSNIYLVKIALNNNLFLIGEHSIGNNIDIFKQILSTFKFLE